MGRHERAVANTFGLAEEAAAKGDFRGALEWLDVLEIVDGDLRPEWEQTRAVSRRVEMPRTCLAADRSVGLRPADRRGTGRDERVGLAWW